MNGYLFCFLIWGICSSNSLDLSPSSVAKTIHKGAYEAVKETVNTVTEVVGTPVELKDVHFFLHTSRDQGYPNHTVDPLQPSEIASREGRVYFLIHGWTQSREKTPWYRPVTEYLLKRHPDAHVVQIDWEKAAANNYPSAAFCTESVGNIIGDVIKKLVVDYNVSRKNVILIGHSLGGQITGWVGKRFRKLTKNTLPRIIALDPAGPLFSSRPEDKRLNKNDAEIVMVLHSDGGKLGFGSRCGSIDFFPNGGSDQPGCYKVDLADVSTLTEPIWCDHTRGYDLFLEALKTPCLFLARKCENYDKFKENKCEDIAISLGDLEASSAGSYYFKTTDKAPFIEIEDLRRNERILEHSRSSSKDIHEECTTLLMSHNNKNDNREEESNKQFNSKEKIPNIHKQSDERKEKPYTNSNPSPLNEQESNEHERDTLKEREQLNNNRQTWNSNQRKVHNDHSSNRQETLNQANNQHVKTENYESKNHNSQTYNNNHEKSRNNNENDWKHHTEENSGKIHNENRHHSVKHNNEENKYNEEVSIRPVSSQEFRKIPKN